MKHNLLTLSALLMFGLSLSGLQAQNSIAATGDDAKSSNGSVSYSVGQIVYTTNSGSNGLVEQGVQQTFYISIITTVEEAKGISLSVSAYPNPTSDFLNLKVDDSTMKSIKSMRYQLFDMSGKLLENKILQGIATTIVMRNLIPATYLLKVIQSKKELKTFKIIKN